MNPEKAKISKVDRVLWRVFKHTQDERARFWRWGQSYCSLQTNMLGEHPFTYPPLQVNFLLHMGMRHLKKSNEAKQIRHNCQDIGKDLKGN